MSEPSAPSPLVSIVVAVRGEWERTYATLTSLIPAAAALPAEIVVVDDASTDETPRALARVEGITHLTNPAPRGLVAARNQGAAAARGRYLAFIGNGAQAEPSWLSPLLAVVGADPAVAAAAPQLVDPAGGRLPANAAMTWASLRGLPLPAREIPCAGLCGDGLLVRAEAFREAGGFDESFREEGADLDLTLRLADGGRRVVHVDGARVRLAVPWGVGLPEVAGDEALLTSRWRERVGAPVQALQAGQPARPLPAITVVGRADLPAAVAQRLAPAPVVLDIGCGIRPQQLVRPVVHVCCEPYGEYLEHLQRNVAGATDRVYLPIQATWDEAVTRFPPGAVDTVFLLDIIEHLEKPAAAALLLATERLPRRQLVVFTTLGFIPQHHPDGRDAWGLGGGTWQEHRSGWGPADFGPGWEVVACPDFHVNDNLGRPYDVPRGALWAFRDCRAAAAARASTTARGDSPRGDLPAAPA